MRALGWTLVALGLLIVVSAPYMAATGSAARHRVDLKHGGWSEDASAGPQAAAGGLVAGLGVLILAIRRPMKAAAATGACAVCGAPSEIYRLKGLRMTWLCARCSGSVF